MKKSFRFIFVMILTMIFVCSCTDSAPEIVPEYKIETGDVNFDGLSVTWGFSMSRYMDGVDNMGNDSNNTGNTNRNGQ